MRDTLKEALTTPQKGPKVIIADSECMLNKQRRVRPLLGKMIKDGKRVPKGNRVVKADGSWREEIRVGKCVTVKEKSSAGEYKESRRCD